MENRDFIYDLIEWLEKNLERKKLNLKEVAHKSGYSLWYLQRLFHNTTGKTLGGYIRSRRLTKAALALRFSQHLIVDIALMYQFDSQQSFTRAFKKQFLLPPSKYRDTKKWHKKGMLTPFYRESKGFYVHCCLAWRDASPPVALRAFPLRRA